MRVLLALDISTVSTGWATFDLDSKKLLAHGSIQPKVPGIHKLQYPLAALLRIKDMAIKVKSLVDSLKPEQVVVEELNRGISRIGNKTLSGAHWFIMDLIYATNPELVHSLKFLDSNGKKGWRGALGLKLSDQDKQINAEIRNKNRRKGAKKTPLVDWKVLAQRYVNATFKLSFNVWANPHDNDVVDAIALGHAHLLGLKK